MPSIQALMQAKKECLELFKSTSARKAANTGFNMCFRFLFGKDLDLLRAENALIKKRMDHQIIGYEARIRMMAQDLSEFIDATEIFVEKLIQNKMTEDHSTYGKEFGNVQKGLRKLRSGQHKSTSKIS